jgi:hypothetical protein
MVAALEPPYARLAQLECEEGAPDELAKRRHIRRRPNGEYRNSASSIAPLAAAVAERWPAVCGACLEAMTFDQALQDLMQP